MDLWRFSSLAYCPKEGKTHHYIRLLRALSSQVLKILSNGNSTASQGNPFQVLSLGKEKRCSKYLFSLCELTGQHICSQKNPVSKPSFT